MTDYAGEIEKDLRWREEELASLRRQVLIAPNGSVQERALLRALCALLYAHYEGFCKFVWDLHLDALSKSGVRRIDCKEPLAKLSLHQEFKGFKSNLSPDAIWDFCQNQFKTLLQEPLIFNRSFETSNLWPNILIEHCEWAMLPHTTVDEHNITLKALVSRRNDIAHGKKNIIASISDYDNYYHAAQLVMHELAVAVLESIEKKSYLK